MDRHSLKLRNFKFLKSCGKKMKRKIFNEKPLIIIQASCDHKLVDHMVYIEHSLSLFKYEFIARSLAKREDKKRIILIIPPHTGALSSDIQEKSFPY